MSVPLVERLRATLREAMVARDRDLVAALRNTLGAIDNATSRGVEAPRAGAIEASATGLAASDVPRSELTDADIEAVVASEISDRDLAAAELEVHGQTDAARTMREATARLMAATRPE